MSARGDVRHARSGVSGPGKYTEEVKCLLDEDTKEELIMLARLYGMGTSEYLRNVIVQHIYGASGAAKDAVQRGGLAMAGKRQE